ncbi:MAG: ABC transporter ATP-binding protein [Candidatus Eisenbacteria bacterium]
MIEIRDLCKSFGSHTVLDHVNLTVRTGETMVVLGRSGSGKSVLLKLVIGLMRSDSGSILVDGEDVTKMGYDELAALRRRFGMLFQMAALFDSMTVGQNVGLALREHTNRSESEIAAIVAQKLEMVGLPGIETKKPAELSGGMRKRVGLARAIAMDPDYLLYDEPTTGLDPVTAEQINQRIVELRQKIRTTSIVVTHDMRSAYTVADRICLIHEQKIWFTGTPEEVRNSEDPVVQQFIRGEARGPLTDDEESSPASSARGSGRRRDGWQWGFGQRARRASGAGPAGEE